MGEARRRGTFEQRKEQAIAAGRFKRPACKKRYVNRLSNLAAIRFLADMGLMGVPFGRVMPDKFRYRIR